MLVANLRLAFFDDTYAPIARANHALISLFADAGFLLVGNAGAEKAGEVLRTELVKRVGSHGAEGSFDDAAINGDGIERMYTYRRIGALPLMLTYGRDYADMLAAWEKRSWSRAIFAAIMFGVFAVLAYLVAAQVQRLQRSRLALRASEEELRSVNAQLEQRIAQRTATLEKSNQELAVALSSLKLVQGELFRAEKMAALGSLVAGVAHELNTPIGIGVVMASSLQDTASDIQQSFDQGKVSRSQMAEFLTSTRSGSEILLRNMERAATLIQSFKQVAVDQAGNERRRFDLQQVLTEIATAHAPLYRKTAFRLELQVPENIKMDSYPGALGQVIVNLLNNALVHGFDGRTEGMMRLSARLLGQDQVEVAFSDDGIGIPAANLRRVYDPFFTTKLGRGGSGLGMHIVYNLVSDILKGSISIESEPGQGTRVAIVMPTCVDGGPVERDGLCAPPMVTSQGTDLH